MGGGGIIVVVVIVVACRGVGVRIDFTRMFVVSSIVPTGGCRCAAGKKQTGIVSSSRFRVGDY